MKCSCVYVNSSAFLKNIALTDITTVLNPVVSPKPRAARFTSNSSKI